MKIKLLGDHAKAPTYATDGSGAMDFYACLPHTNGLRVPVGTSVMVSLGVSIQVPKDHGLLLLSRSGHGAKNAVRLGNCVGLIDSDYRGPVMAAITCDDRESEQPFVINHGDRIAQGCIVYMPQVTFEIVDELDPTDRGAGGFGSTGTN